MSTLSDSEVAAILFSPCGPEGVCAMLFSYFDESGTDGTSQHVVIAGFIGSIAEWGHVMRAWQQELERAGVSPFHRVECKGRNGPYNGWPRDKAQDHVARLSAIASDSDLIPISASFNGVWENVQLPDPQRYTHPYHVCFELLIATVIDRAREYYPGSSIVVVMERQDQFSTRAQNIYDIFKFNGRWSDISHFSYSEKQICEYLQLADLFAWEVRRYFWSDKSGNLKEDEYPLIRRLMGQNNFKAEHIGIFLDEGGMRIALTQESGLLTIPPNVSWV